MNYHTSVRRSGSNWQAEAWLECTTETLELVEVAGWFNETVAVLHAPIPWWLDALTSRASFNDGGLYDEARGSRISPYSLSGELSKRFFDWTFHTASWQTVRLRELLEGIYLQSSRDQIDQFIVQSQEYVSGLEMRVGLERLPAIEQCPPNALDRSPYRNKIK